MNKLLFILPFALVSCIGTPKPVEVYKEVPVPVDIYPYQEDLKDFDNDFPMDEVQFDIPRNMAATPTLKAGCSPPAANYAADDPCLIYPPDPASNLFVGVDQANWEKLITNLQRFAEKERLRDLQDEAVNKQRAEWREKNKQALEGLQDE